MRNAIAPITYFGGLSAVSYGFYLAWEPLGWIVGGALLFGISLLLDRTVKGS